MVVGSWDYEGLVWKRKWRFPVTLSSGRVLTERSCNIEKRLASWCIEAWGLAGLGEPLNFPRWKVISELCMPLGFTCQNAGRFLNPGACPLRACLFDGLSITLTGYVPLMENRLAFWHIPVQGPLVWRVGLSWACEYIPFGNVQISLTLVYWIVKYLLDAHLHDILT